MIFVDASELTYDGGNDRTELFNDDGIHLNHDGQLLRRNEYIKPQIAVLLGE